MTGLTREQYRREIDQTIRECVPWYDRWWVRLLMRWAERHDRWPASPPE